MGMGVAQPSFGPINSAKSPVQSLPSPVTPYPEMPGGKIDPPGLYPPSPPQPPQARSGYYSGSMRPPMGYYQAPNRPYGGGKGGGLPPFAMPFGGGFGGYRGLTYAQPMFQPQPSFNLNQGPFGGGQFRRNFGTFNQGPFPLPQIANAYQGPMEPQQIQRVSAEDAYKQAQIEAQKARASGNMGRVVLPGEQSFEEFERNYNFRPQQQLLQAPTGALGGLGQLVRSGFFR